MFPILHSHNATKIFYSAFGAEIPKTPHHASKLKNILQNILEFVF